MTKYEVINIGQGDCMIIRPENCMFSGKVLMIDLGPGTVDVTDYIDKDNDIHIFLTHHDMDHVGGFKYFWGQKINKVKEITVPFYQNEITLIARALLGLKGINNATNSAEFIDGLEQIVSNQTYLKSLLDGSMSNQPKLSFGYQGKAFCKHIKCLNPSKEENFGGWLDRLEEEEIRILMEELFEYNIARQLTIYFGAKKRNQRRVDSRIIENLELRMGNEEFAMEDLEKQKGNYVMNFIQRNLKLLRMVNIQPERKSVSKVYSKFLKASHDVSLVLKLEYGDKSMLATGDASKKVFNRLINEHEDISATYLKVPHHGSKKNISEKILDAISPQKAIISHNNRKFGNAKDSHPNIEVIDMLRAKKIKILVTNDVIKGDPYHPIIKKSVGSVDGIIEFK